jgi:hypothetical protein
MNTGNPQKKVFAEVYGDESIFQNAVVYATVFVPLVLRERTERILSETKKAYDVAESAELHCRQIFHPHQRRKTPWAHLSYNQIFDFAGTLATSLGQTSILFKIGFLDKKKAPKRIDGIGPIKTTKLGDKQLIIFAYFAAMGEFDKWPGFNKIRFWADPDRTKIEWFSGKSQAGRTYKMFSDLSGKINEIVPESIVGEKPRLLELADFVAYISSHALSSQHIRNKKTFIALYETLNPSKTTSTLILDGQGGCISKR